MILLINRLFPVAALLFAAAAYLFPAPFASLSGAVVPLLGIIMFGMGVTLTPHDFADAVRKPKAVTVGLVLQFTVMPLTAFLLAHLLRLPHSQTIGMVMVGAVAGGTASNVITYLAGGDVALSITMTACSTLAGIFMTPLLANLYLGQSVDVPVAKMFLSILNIVALPVGLGLAVRSLLRERAARIERLAPLVSVIGIVLVIAVIVALNRDDLRTGGLTVLAAVILHNLIGMSAGYGGARLMRCDRRTAVTVAIETGMQNSGLAVALSKQFFGIAAALPGAVFSIWHNLSGALFAAIVGPRLRRRTEEMNSEQ